MSEEEVRPPARWSYAVLKDDRVGMTAEELLDRAEIAFAALDKEINVLMQNLPRKYEKRLHKTSANKSILRECIKGARTRIEIVRKTMGKPKET